MNCPKCEEGTLIKIRFRVNGRMAYLCDICKSFWWNYEVISMFTGHMIDDSAKDYEYFYEKDKEQQDIKDDKERTEYEQLKRVYGI